MLVPRIVEMEKPARAVDAQPDACVPLIDRLGPDVGGKPDSISGESVARYRLRRDCCYCSRR
jgi:hypothetical protein